MKLKLLNESPTLKIYAVTTETQSEITVVDGKISAGFPSPAADFVESKIDLNKYLIHDENTTFVAEAKGNSLQGAGINDKDLLIIDKSLEPKSGKIAVCVLDGEFVMKRLKVEKDCIWLIPENDEFKPTKVTELNDFEIWGMLMFSIQKHY